MSDSDEPVQVWELDLDDRRHRVEVRGSVLRRLRWYVDHELVAEKRSSDDKVRLRSGEHPEVGVVVVRFSGLGSPRRATLFDHKYDEMNPEMRAMSGFGGIDFEPRRGSPAAQYEAKLRAHPRRYAALQTTFGIAKVVIPLIAAALVARFAFSIPLPHWDLPNLPRLDLPDIPWPDLPAIPWPDWTLPGWLGWILEHAKYVAPIVVAVLLARAEIRRRRKQDELRAQRALPSGATSQEGGAERSHDCRGCVPERSASQRKAAADGARGDDQEEGHPEGGPELGRGIQHTGGRALEVRRHVGALCGGRRPRRARCRRRRCRPQQKSATARSGSTSSAAFPAAMRRARARRPFWPADERGCEVRPPRRGPPHRLNGAGDTDRLRSALRPPSFCSCRVSRVMDELVVAVLAKETPAPTRNSPMVERSTREQRAGTLCVQRFETPA